MRKFRFAFEYRLPLAIACFRRHKKHHHRGRRINAAGRHKRLAPPPRERRAESDAASLAKRVKKTAESDSTIPESKAKVATRKLRGFKIYSRAVQFTSPFFEKSALLCKKF